MQKEFNHIFWLLTEAEIDLVNVLLHIIEKHDNILAPPEVGVELELNRCITTNMHDISASLGYTDLNINNILTLLDQLTTRVATIYYRLENGRQMEKGAFLNKYTVTSTDNDINKRITLWINADLVNVLQKNTHLFESFYKHARFEIKGKYSTMIYDYFNGKGHGKEVFLIDEFAQLMDFDLTTSKWEWSRLNSNILKRASKELNEKTDLHIDYDKVKTSAGGRIQTTQVEVSYYTAKGEADFSEYFKPQLLMDRKVEYYVEKWVLEKFATVQQFKDKSAIANPDAYLAKMRREAMKDRAEVEAKIEVQEWSNAIKYEYVNEDGLVGIIDFNKHDFVTVNNDYKLFDPMTKEELSTSARDTVIKLAEYFEQEIRGGFTIYSMPEIKNCSISYSKG